MLCSLKWSEIIPYAKYLLCVHLLTDLILDNVENVLRSQWNKTTTWDYALENDVTFSCVGAAGVEGVKDVHKMN